MANTIYDAIAEGLIPQPVTLMDLSGAPYVASGGGGGSVTINDPTTTSQKLAVDSTGKIGINNFPAFIFDGSGNLKVNVVTGGSGGSAGYPATADGIAASNINELGVALYNGTTFDRWESDATGKARVSLYGKNSVAGDTPLGVDASGYIGIRNFPYHFDSAGNLMTNAFAPNYMSNSGGPALASGTPSGLSFDIQREIQGKGSVTATITSTNIGDTSLTFSSAPLNLAAGSPVYLVQGGATAAETVYVSTTFAPGTGVTNVPLQSPVRYASHTTAVYDIYSATGPTAASPSMTPIGINPVGMAYFNPSNAAPLQYEITRGINGWASQIDYIDYLIVQQGGYQVTTDIVGPTSAAGTFPFSIFQPNSKNMLIYSILVNCTVAGAVKLTYTSTNPAYGTTLTPTNNVPGSSNTSTAQCTMTTTNTGFPGGSVHSIPFSQAQLMEILPDNKKIWLPGYASKGVTLWLITGASISQWSVTTSWIEY